MKVIENGFIYNDKEKEFQKGLLIIKDENIADVIFSVDDETKIDPKAEKIDATGLYVMPGFIDTSSQIGLRETGVRWEGDDSYEPLYSDPLELSVVDGIYPFDMAFAEAVSEGVTASHVMAAPNQVIGGKTAVIHTSGKTVDQMIVNSDVGYSFSMGELPKTALFEHKKLPLTRMAIAKQIRDAMNELRKEDQLNGKEIFIRCHRADDIATAIRIGKECEVHITLVHATEFSSTHEKQANGSVDVIAGPAFQPMIRQELQHLHPSLYKRLSATNLSYALASDHPTSSVAHLRLEGILALKQGLKKEDVLNQLTIEAAKIVGCSDRIGSLEKGKFADVVLWNDHPLTYGATVERTYIKGEEVYKEMNVHA